MIEKETYYVWRSDSRSVSTVEASSMKAAADQFALRERVPYNIALRVVPVRDVRSFGIRVSEGCL